MPVLLTMPLSGSIAPSLITMVPALSVTGVMVEHEVARAERAPHRRRRR